MALASEPASSRASASPTRSPRTLFLRLQVLAWLCTSVWTAFAGKTTVAIEGDEFLINGQPTYAGQFWKGHRIQGLLFNARTVQATFDDANPETRGRWAYPDSGTWDPDRNTREFINALGTWKQHGLLSFTLNLQGGSPEGYSKAQPWRNSAFRPDGSLDPAYFARLKRILDRADELGMVPILGLFYFGQDQVLRDETAVLRAVDLTLEWLFQGNWRNVVIEINNECDVLYDHPILQPGRVHELIQRVHSTRRDGRRFLVSTSFAGGKLPTSQIVQASDFVLLHGNGIPTPQDAAALVRKVRALPEYKKKPIVFNEDDHTQFGEPLNHLVAAVTERASWGFFDYRRSGEDLKQGFQSVPVDWTLSSARKQGFFGQLADITGSLPKGAQVGTHAGARWWKGNLHTHSLWSDGDDYPEMIAEWYLRENYHFLGLSDHNITLEGQNWFTTSTSRGGGETLAKYRQRFGSWVEQRSWLGTNQVRLKPLSEFRSLLEVPERFLLIPSMELTDRYLTWPIHINVTNPRDRLEPHGGSNVLDAMQHNVNNVLRQRGRTGQPMFPHINHPNFNWGITAEDLLPLQGERFFEIYNGHPMVHNEGDESHAGMERLWDILLAQRLGVLHLPPVFGLAVDDSHNYHAWKTNLSNPGRGWVMVRSPRLTAEGLISSLEMGDFYSSSGVVLEDIRRTSQGLQIQITPIPGVTFTTEFIGTRQGFDPASTPFRNAAGDKLRVTHRYSDAIGEVLATSRELNPTYSFAGDELYVRARITSSRLKTGSYRTDEFEKAWVQPVIP